MLSRTHWNTSSGECSLEAIPDERTSRRKGRRGSISMRAESTGLNARASSSTSRATSPRSFAVRSSSSLLPCSPWSRTNASASGLLCGWEPRIASSSDRRCRLAASCSGVAPLGIGFSAGGTMSTSALNRSPMVWSRQTVTLSEDALAKPKRSPLRAQTSRSPSPV